MGFPDPDNLHPASFFLCPWQDPFHTPLLIGVKLFRTQHSRQEVPEDSTDGRSTRLGDTEDHGWPSAVQGLPPAYDAGQCRHTFGHGSSCWAQTLWQMPGLCICRAVSKWHHVVGIMGCAYPSRASHVPTPMSLPPASLSPTRPKLSLPSPRSRWAQAPLASSHHLAEPAEECTPPG